MAVMAIPIMARFYINSCYYDKEAQGRCQAFSVILSYWSGAEDVVNSLNLK